MQQNLSNPDRYFRLATGLVSLTAATRRRQSPLTQAFLLSFGAMKVAEGVTGWCPIRSLTNVLAQPSAGSSKSEPSKRKQSATSTSSSDSKKRQDDDSHSYSVPEDVISYLMDQDDVYPESH